MTPLKIAIIGTGIAGNVAAHRLHRAGHDITVYEADDHIGGHTHTHRIELDGEVQHDRHRLHRLQRPDLPELHRAARRARRGIAAELDELLGARRARGLEYNGTSLNGLFAQRRNLLRPRFLGMLADILRFNREAPRAASRRRRRDHARRRISRRTVSAAASSTTTSCRWARRSGPPTRERMLEFPARFFVRFLHNHGMLTVNDRPAVARDPRRLGALRREARRAVSRPHPPPHCRCESIRRRPDGVLVQARGREPERYDHVFLACHADQALRLLADPSPQEREILGALPYQRNEARAAHRHLAAAAAPPRLGGVELPPAAERAGRAWR